MQLICPNCHMTFTEKERTDLYCESCYRLISNVGMKFDSDKPKMELLDPYAIEQLAMVLTFGAKKYGAWNWAKGLSYSRLIGAALRHLFAFVKGEDLDEESNLPHLAHCFCCIMMLLAMTQRHSNLDDRNKP